MLGGSASAPASGVSVEIWCRAWRPSQPTSTSSKLARSPRVRQRGTQRSVRRNSAPSSALHPGPARYPYLDAGYFCTPVLKLGWRIGKRVRRWRTHGGTRTDCRSQQEKRVSTPRRNGTDEQLCLVAQSRWSKSALDRAVSWQGVPLSQWRRWSEKRVSAVKAEVT
ncbi:hypothetical protein BJY59DRAFT_132340 [Rhodotorula toruloides]